MEEAVYYLERLLTLALLAIALGLDAFSLGLGVGLQGLRRRRILAVSLLIGLFHVVVPLIGMALGRWLSHSLGEFAVGLGGLLLLLMGIRMIIGSLFAEEGSSVRLASFWSVLLFAMTVSIDSLPVGITMGLSYVSTWAALAMFGLFAFFLSGTGLVMGRHAGAWLGGYSEMVGGVILMLFGFKFLF